MGYKKPTVGAYRAVHEQGFLPIFTDDELDSKELVEATVDAGCRAIEYTLRRRDAHKMIPWIRDRYPDLALLVGSTIDDDSIVRQMRAKHPQLRTLDELAGMGVDGFVSVLGWKLENIRRFAASHLVIPSASTGNEAYQAVVAGAHFIKVAGPDLGIVRACRMEAMFGYCPIMVSGGQTPERIPQTIAAGAMLIGTGFDLMLGTKTGSLSRRTVTETVARYLAVTQAARASNAPPLAPGPTSDDASWLAGLPHTRPF